MKVHTLKTHPEPFEGQVSGAHCWEHRERQPDGPCPHPEYNDDCSRNCWMFAHFGPSGSCMLEHGHDGEHEFTDDDKIGVTFASPGEEERR